MLSTTRITIIAALLIGATICINVLDKGISVPIKRPLETFPRQIGEWSFVTSRPLPQKVEQMLGVDDYIECDYVSSAGHIVNFYASYFSSMEGKGFHSPRNCMPGGGWDVASLKPLAIEVHHSESTPVEINEMILQKGADKRVVLYWYQCRGRFIRSEYWEKIYQVLDSIFKRRTDGSFIRIMAPVTNANIEHTTQYLADFTKEVIPILDNFLPGG